MNTTSIRTRSADSSNLSVETKPRFGRLLRIVAIMMTAVTFGLLGSLAPASASQGNYDFDAYCQANHSIQAWAPDLTHDDGSWITVWAPSLYRYTSNGWVDYLHGPTQTEYGGDWVVQSFIFSNLPTGYYQVRDTYAWVHNGAETTYAINQPVPHYLDGNSSFYGASLPTLEYSTRDYCYMS